MVAINTSEMRVLDLWHNTAASNDDSFYLNKLVNIIWSKISLQTRSPQIDWSHLDNRGRMRVMNDLLVEECSHLVEEGNHF